DILQQAVQALLQAYDWSMGGWGRAPRFPQPMVIEFLLQQATRGDQKALEAAVHVLDQMSRGGMYDVVGGGFHRYSTDDSWLVPHFEKMLYDNAQLALAYLHAYLLTGKVAFKQVCTETLDFIHREMTHPEGGFFSSLDADTEGQEGKYYIWLPAEIETALPDPASRELFAQVYPVTAQGNFEGHNILQRKGSLEELAGQLGLPEIELIERLESIHRQLYATREQRVRPATDDKVLVSWNSLALRAFAQAARYLRRDDYLAIARKNADFLLKTMYVDGRLLRAWRIGQARHSAFLEDHAGLALALLDLYQSDPDLRWYQAAGQLAGDLLEHFRDPQGGFFDTRSDQETLITRPKEIQDNATPSGSALAASALLLLSAYNDNGEWRALADYMLSSLQDLLVRHPTAFGFWLQGLDFAFGPVKQIAVVGPLSSAVTQAMLAAVWRTFRPRSIVAVSDQTVEPAGNFPELLLERGMIEAKPTAYVCQGFVCNLPAKTPEALQQQLETVS
ncbi:MAG: thioredoxin domain-containing protein, partial [Chloroflexi bacterium]